MNDAPPSDDYAAALLKSMLEIPSPSYGEAELAHHLLGVLRELGFVAYLDGAGNVVGELDLGAGPTVMLLGHLDTVPGTRPVRFDGGRLYGRGAVDAKGPLATMICAAARCRTGRGRVVVVGAVEEETPGSRGAMYVRGHYPKPDAIVIGEPSGWSSVVLGFKGKLDLRYRVTCAATHPSSPAPKATELAAKIWAELLDLLGPDVSHLAFDRPGATLVSNVGDLTAAVADFCVRLPPDFDVTALLAALRERDGGLGALEVLNAVPACRVSRTDPVVKALCRAIRDRGTAPTTKLKTATSDMNTLAEVWSVPMATYGPGDSRLDHSDAEHIVLDEYFHGIEVLTAAVTALTGAPSGEGRHGEGRHEQP